MGGGKDGRKGVLFLELRDPKNYSSSLKNDDWKTNYSLSFWVPSTCSWEPGCRWFQNNFCLRCFIPKRLGRCECGKDSTTSEESLGCSYAEILGVSIKSILCLDLPSKICVFSPKKLPKGGNVTYLEDPGIVVFFMCAGV